MSSKPGFIWLLKMAWRDGKASSGRLFLFVASIILGIAAVVSIQSFSENLKKNISLQSKSLMGADYIIDSDAPINDRVQEIIDSLGGPGASEVSFASMVAFPQNETSKLMDVRGIKGDFPFYGEIESMPADAGRNFQKNNGALVDATVMLQLDLDVGDSLKIGESVLPISGKLNAVPGSTQFFSAIAPPVIIPYEYAENSGLIQTGSRIEYKYYFVAEENTSMEFLDENLDPMLDREDADLDTHTSTSQRMGRRYENFAKFLNLVAFIALLLGCVGISSSVNIYIKEKLASIAVLKCLGASQKQSFLIYLIQIAGIGLIGGILGAAGGVALQQLFPIIIQDLLPVEVEIFLEPQVIFTGIALGTVMSVIFSFYPLLNTFNVSPLRALRVQDAEGISWKKGVFVIMGIFLFIFLFAFWLLDNWLFSFYFVLGVALTFLIISGIAKLFMKFIRKNFPHSWGFESRQSLLNLFRPQNQTMILIVSIGIGTFLISTLYFTRDLLLAQASLEDQGDSPNIILLDVQNSQQEEVASTIQNNNLPVIENIPIVTMRVANINGKSVAEIRKDSTSRIHGWILHHEFRTTYRDDLIASEELEEGEFIGTTTEKEMIPVSVSRDFANNANIALGDEMTFNVQGVMLKTVISSIRLVDWTRMQMNFNIVFPEGVLEEAPQFRVFTTKVANDAQSANLQQDLVQAFPNISVLDLRQIVRVIEDILSKIGWLINFMAFFSIIIGIIVLIGAVRTSKFQRVKESVLLRTIGAKSRQILKIMALEYFFLGILGALSGILLSLISSQLLAWFLFETTFIPSAGPFLILLPGITILVLAIGLTNSLSVIKSPPLKVLRKEAA